MNTPLPQTTVEFLQAALRALNEIPNTRLKTLPYRNTYMLCTSIEKHLSSLSDNPQTRDCVIYVVYTVENGQQEEYFFRLVDELTARREGLDSPNDIEETKDILNNATKICKVDCKDTFIEDGGSEWVSVDGKPARKIPTGYTSIKIISGRIVTHEKESIIPLANRLDLCFDLRGTHAENELIEFANALHYPPR